MTTITQANAYRFSDNFTIQTADGCTFYGCEHNQQEADAIARYLSNYHGRKVVVVRNGQDAVRAAKEIRGNQVSQVKNRELILKDIGVWN